MLEKRPFFKRGLEKLSILPYNRIKKINKPKVVT